jgi:hypothetical protein
MWLTLVLLELVKIGGLDTAEVLPKSIDLARYRSPEYLIEHGVGHVVVCATFLVLGYSECVLDVSGVQLASGWTYRICSCSRPRHLFRQHIDSRLT